MFGELILTFVKRSTWGFDLRKTVDGVGNGGRLSVQKENCEALMEIITKIDR